jgi:molybdopterin molybdotransferase
MLTVDHAIDRLRTSARCLVTTESVPVVEAANRILSQDLVAAIDVPPADNSAMDGYALRRDDWPGPDTAMVVSQRIAAGSVGEPLKPGTAARIFTGASVPAGADTVVMQENSQADGANSIRILELAERGANIRPRGQDTAAGDGILARGSRLRAQELGLIASQGHASVRCYQKLRVAHLSTGNELLNPGEPIGPGQIYNSNRFTVAGLLQAWGFEIVDLGIAHDDPHEIRQALKDGAEKADVVITSGGVSVGEEDHVRDVVESMGAINLWKILIKPGKPFAFGHIGETPFLGLPGNPVSVFVTMLIVARPFLMDCQGALIAEQEPVRMPAAFEKAGSSREDYLRVRLTQQGLERFPVDSSGVLNSLCWSDGLVRQRVSQAIRAGDEVDYFPFRLLL